ncbi:zinc finger protein 385C-like [Electrophorus electricus]|uniref:zinc finger protein 385C-like n=1 Tax=Electrophorus electricus TaxID=8005 RepID=UPI0015D02087|nr:zinc finger protein 385C-like [Electrophorus electricus]
MILGSPIQGSPLLTSLSLPGRQLQSPLDLKHFLPLRVNGSAPFSLFPNFHTTDPIQKAVINHTFGLPQIVKKKQIISCNICHLRFNSTSQAEAHYRGHKHARRLKASDHVKNKQKKQGFHMGRDRHTHRQQEKGKTGHTPALIDSSPSERTVPLCDPQAAHVNAEEADAERDPVTFTHISEACLLDTAPPPSPQLSCVPQGSSSFSSKASVPESSSIDSEWAPHPPGEQQSGAGAKEEEAGGKKISKQNLHCAICKVTVNSISQLEAHYSGSKHKLMLEGQCVQPRRRGGKVISSHMNPRPKRHGNKNNATSLSQSHHCHVCNIAVNSESQLKQHLSSRRHKDRLAGKPTKPKFSPYKSPANSLLANVELAGLSSRAGSAFGGICRSFSLSTVTPQNVELAGLSSRAGSAFGGICRSFSLSTVTPQTKLALQKELSKTLTAGFLTSSLTSATLCTMATNPLTLRHTPAPTSIIQSPLLTPGLFRPAPGPLRASHAPIIFSPY